jgi:TPP-dependent pyruvate/acetoin dehydrogenase alpha subunit
MEYTSIHTVTAVEHPAADRACAYGLEPVLIDGNDVDVVYETASRALEQARRGGGPSLIEAETYRHGGHSRADPGKYRPDSEVQEWLARDPIPRYRDRLLGLGIDEPALAELEAEIQAEVDSATEEARQSPPPNPEIAEIDVWADGGSAWRN